MKGLAGATMSHDVLRSVVAQFRRAEHRQRFPATVRVGSPGSEDVTFAEGREMVLDHALRTEVVAALLSRALTHPGEPTVWLTRSGAIGTEDTDLQWYAAARAAYGEVGVPLEMVVITRSGWCDPVSSQHREWKRLRVRT